MKYRSLGRTGLYISELGFGCGSVGGLLVRGNQQEMLRTVERAIELGINYFDTASIYGDGKSETNLGRVLQELEGEIFVGTKVRLTAPNMERTYDAVIESVTESLRRLQLNCIDLIQLHNPIQLHKTDSSVGLDDLEPVMQAFQDLQKQGKVRFYGINGLGETTALLQALEITEAHSIQTCYNLINPSAGQTVPDRFPFQDYGQLIHNASTRGMGVIAIRVLAGGALSGTDQRHPNAAQTVSPIATGKDYSDDVQRSRMFQFLIDQGYASNLVEAGIRFAISNPEITTALVGFSSLEQLDQAAEYVTRGPLSPDALQQLETIWRQYQT